VVLLVIAGLTVRGFVSLRQAELGFRPERVMALDLPLPPKRYTTWDQRNNFARELLERARSLPEVQAVTIGNGGLPFDAPDSNYTVEGQEKPEDKQISFCLISDDYFRTLAIPLRRGRTLSQREIQSAQPVAVINEAAVKLWPAGEDPIGRLTRGLCTHECFGVGNCRRSRWQYT
jgi:putative ABC transport system permease protein